MANRIHYSVSEQIDTDLRQYGTQFKNIYWLAVAVAVAIAAAKWYLQIQFCSSLENARRHRAIINESAARHSEGRVYLYIHFFRSSSSSSLLHHRLVGR